MKKQTHFAKWFRFGLNGILGMSMVILLWLGLAYYVTERLGLEVVPYPATVWDVFQEETVQEDLWFHFKISTQRILLGMGVATLFGWLLGLILGQSKGLNRLLSPLLGLVYPVPKVVFLPVVLVLFGIGDESKVALVALVVFFQILVVVRDEALTLSPELIESVRSLGAGRRALYWFVYIPASFGAVLTAWRVSVGVAVAVLFIAESAVTQEGLGYYIMNRNFRLRYDEMYAGIIAMSLLGVGLYGITDILDRLFGQWKRER